MASNTDSMKKSDEKFRVDNKVAIIYGGSYGIGKGISKILSKAGAIIIIVARNKEKGECLKLHVFGHTYL